MTQHFPLLRSLASVRESGQQRSDVPAVMACAKCEVTWRDVPGAPCWFCGDAGEIANPKRLILD